MLTLSDIRRVYRGEIALSVPLSGLTSFRVGGGVDYLFEPASVDDAREILTLLREQRVPTLLVARGCNLLASDAGFRGAAVSLERACSTIHVRSSDKGGLVVEAGAGARLVRLVDFCVEHGIAGAERFAGIPGTVAGFILENASASGDLLRDAVLEVHMLRGGHVQSVPGPDLATLRHETGSADDVMLTAILRLKGAPVGDLLRARREALVQRNDVRPLNIASAGLAFRDPANASAVQLLREAGCAGMACGGAVALAHFPNYIANTGNATASDVLALVSRMQRAVRERSGVQLGLLARPVGFGDEIMREVA